MKNKAILVSFIALFAMIFALSTVIASEVDITINDVIVNDVSIDGPTAAGYVSDTVPVEIKFTANEDVSDVRVKVYIEGYKDEVSDSTSRFHIVEGSSYIKRFSLRLPSSTDLDDLTEDLTLLVRVSAKEKDSFEELYAIRMQRNLYSLNILSIETIEKVASGSIVALNVVLENNGNDRLENVYAKASIPELGIESLKVYFGDIDPQDETEIEYDDSEEWKDLDREDSVRKKIYLSIPRNAIPGTYNIEVEAYNYDTTVTEKKQIVIGSTQTGIYPSVMSKAISIGEDTTFDIPLVNYGNRMVVYSLTPEESQGLIIEVEQPIVTVSADSSEIVKIRVKATQSAEEGTHLVTINVNTESGLVKKVTFTVNVEESGITSKPNSVLILTVILAIVFVVLLIILIVLLTKKPAEAEELGEGGETSYY